MTVIFKYGNIIKDSPALTLPVRRSEADLRSPAGPDPRGTSGVYFGMGELPSLIRRQQQERVSGEVGRRLNQLKEALDDVGHDSPPALPRLSHDRPQRPAVAGRASTAPYLSGPQKAPDSGPTEPRIEEVITSSWFNPHEAVQLAPGQYAVTLDLEGRHHEFNLEVKPSAPSDGSARRETQTQQELLADLANTINGLDPRMEAELQRTITPPQDSDGFQPWLAKVRLVIKPTGEALPSFSLHDEGGLIKSLSLNAMAQALAPPAPAPDRPEEKTPFMQEEALSADDAQPQPAQPAAQSQPSETGQSKAFSEVLNVYHGLLDYLDVNRDVLRPSLKDSLIRPLEDRASFLPGLGLKATVQGRLEVSSAFDELIPAKLDQLHEVMLGPLGWLPALRHNVEQLQEIKPESYITDTVVSAWEQSNMALLLEELVGQIINGHY